MMRFHGLYNLGIIAVGLAASLVWVDDASGCRHRRNRRAGCHGGGYTYAAPACGSYYGGSNYGNGYAPYGNSKGYDVAPPAPGAPYGAPPAVEQSVTPPASAPGPAATRGAAESETRSFSDQAAEVPPAPPAGESTQPIESQGERAVDENTIEESSEQALETSNDAQETIEAPAVPQ